MTLSIWDESCSAYSVSQSSASLLIRGADSFGGSATIHRPRRSTSRSVGTPSSPTTAGSSFWRTNDSQSLTVAYDIDLPCSTEVAGVDYDVSETSGTVSFAAGESAVALEIDSLDDTATQPESVTVWIDPTQIDNEFSVNSDSAGLNIFPAPPPPTVTVSAAQTRLRLAWTAASI